MAERIRHALRALLVGVVVTLGACAGPAPAPSGAGTTDRVAGARETDGSWVVLAPAGGPAADSARVLVETALRERGVRRVSRGRDGATPVLAATTASAVEASLRRARADGHRYAALVSVERWQRGARPGERPRVALAIDVRDLVSGHTLHGARAERGGRGRDGVTATAVRTVAAALDGLVVPAGQDDPAATAPTTAERSGARDGTSSADERIGADSPSNGPLSGAIPPSVAGVTAALASDGSYAAAVGGALALDGLAGLGLRTTGDAVRTDAATARALEGRATAFFYGRDLPLAALAQFDRVVLEPDNATAAELETLAARGAATFAYVSVGEVGPHRAWRGRVDDSWVLGRNAAWDSDVMDLASGWGAFLDERVDALVARGYAGLFLDTMDSHVAHADTPEARAEQARALVDFVRRTKARHPTLRLVANRGFEVLGEIGPWLEAIAAESLYARWDNVAGRYAPVPAADRDWLLARLEDARSRHGLDVVVIDYVPPTRRDAARAVAARIAADGFVPWVATPALDHVGVGAIDVVPREVLLVFDSRINGPQADAEVHRLLATPLEYLGLVPVYHDVATDALPPTNLGGRFAGVAHWARSSDVSAELQGWIETQMTAGVPVALFGSPWIAPGSALAARAGLAIDAVLDADSLRVRESDALIGFEKPFPRRVDATGRQARSTGAANTVHLGVEDGEGRAADLVVTGPWGGLAAQPGAITLDLDDVTHWIVDPYAFFRRAFRLPDAPMPDVTSEGGRRLWLAHIDGDALPSWSELPGRRLGAEVIRERILDRYPLPHTISIVEAEMTRIPAYFDRRTRMFAVARELFARPNVEIASHTFSHPYRWRALAERGGSGVHNLRVAGYAYSPTREVGGSAAFIDRELAPPGKRTEVMLWSGDALPNEADLAAADAAGLVNMNGGFTTIDRARPALSLVTPMVRTVGARTQVYAPIMNENVYTNDWRGPFDGFRRVIETFELTERPRRLKPLNIYYHFYIGTKAAGIRSLEEVYAWSLAQDVHPVTAGDYARRVRVFREAGVARRLDGSWRVDGLDGLRSVRVVGDRVRLERRGSDGVADARRLHDGLYLRTDGRGTVRIALEPIEGGERRPPSSPEGS